MDLYVAALVALLLVLVAIYATSGGRAEHYDTYGNHDRWAQGYYHTDPETASIKARYLWSEKDKRGMTIYDDYYENISANYLNGGDPEYYDRERETGSAYDTKFSTISGNFYGIYNIKDMIDQNPATVTFNGNVLELSQKNY